MVEMIVTNFNLEQICRSGQCFRMKQICRSGQSFRMEQIGSGQSFRIEQISCSGESLCREQGGKEAYSVIAGNKYLEILQQGETCFFDCSHEEFDCFWRSYFDLDSDYGRCIEKVNPRDAYLVNAASFGSGIRILRQDLWEMIVSFLISQQNNIVRIRRCIENICERYGERMQDKNGRAYYAFPAPEALAGLEEDALKECNLGYRSRYVVRAARSVVSGELDLEAVRGMPYKKAKETLLTLFGVGEKVADCICLFALHHLEAFPVDTHISQAMQKHYKRGFPNRRYKGLQGVMQQYIFYYELFGTK